MWQRLGLIVVLIAACAGLARLGLWQLDRAAVKRERHAAFVERQAARPLDIDALAADAAPAAQHWRRASVQGRYTAPHVLLDNQVNGGQVGYAVMSPFITAGGRLVMVHRGWIKLPGARTTLPRMDTPAGSLRLAGHLGPPPVSGVRLGSGAGAEWMSEQVVRVQHADYAALDAVVDHAVWPLMLHLEPGAPGSYRIDPQPPGDGAARHTAYAVQWFAMALVLGLLGAWHLRRRTRTHDG